MALADFKGPAGRVAIVPDIDKDVKGMGVEAQPPADTTSNGNQSSVEPPAKTTVVQQTTDKPDYAAQDKAEYDEIAAAEQKKIDAWRQYLDSIPAPETEEERNKRERKEKAKKIIGAVSDGIRAMSNLYFTTQYAPDSYNPRNSQLDASTRAIEKAKAERQANLDRYHQYSINIAGAEANKARTMAELRGQQEARQIARDKAKREAEAHSWEANLQPFKQRELAGKATKAEQDAITAAERAKNAPELYSNEAKLAGEKINTEKTKQRNNIASAGAHNRSNPGRVKHHFLGEEYESDKDYAKEVLRAANEYNNKHKGEPGFEPIITEDMEDTGYRKARKPRAATEIAAEVERRVALDGKGKGYGGSNNRGY